MDSLHFINLLVLVVRGLVYALPFGSAYHMGA